VEDILKLPQADFDCQLMAQYGRTIFLHLPDLASRKGKQIKGLSNGVSGKICSEIRKDLEKNYPPSAFKL